MGSGLQSTGFNRGLLRINPIPVLPAFLLGGGFTFNSRNIYRQYSENRSINYQVQLIVNPPTAGAWKTVVAPTIPGYTLVGFNYNGVYNGVTTTYNGANFMYAGTLYFAPPVANQLHYIDISLVYLLN